MSTSAIELVHDRHYMDRIPSVAEQFAKSNMCPDQFRGKPADVAVIAYSLAALDIRLSFPVLSQCYVVHGKPGLMAQLQSGLASRHGVTIRPIPDRCDDKSATVEVGLSDGKRYEVTFTYAEAERAGLTKPAKSGEPSMYAKWPANMLVARATTRAISWYCPEVKLGLAGAGVVDVEEIETVEAAGQTPMVPPRSQAPDGSTIPEYLREPEIDDAIRADLIARLEALEGTREFEDLRQHCRDLGIPNLRSHRVTGAHGALLDRLIGEAETSSGRGVIDVEEVPPEVHDDAPEANGQLPIEPSF